MTIEYPLGIAPKEVWDAMRIKGLKEAIERYKEAGIDVPAQWIHEYNVLVNSYKLADSKSKEATT